MKANKKNASKKSHGNQLLLLDKAFNKPKDQFGGSLLKSNPKTKRPLVTNFPIHLVLRSNYSTLKLPKNYGKVHKELFKVAKKYGIKIYKCANVGNHLHLVIKLTKLKLWKGFIRELTSRIAFIAGEDTHSQTEAPKKKFWKYRPFTRIIRGWRKAFKTILKYVELNQWEAQGHISRKDIKTLKDLRLLFESG